MAPDVLKGRRPFRLEAVASSEVASSGRCLALPLEEPAFRRSPDARTRQIQIRNRQQQLHTAGEGEWQAKWLLKLWNVSGAARFVTLISG